MLPKNTGERLPPRASDTELLDGMISNESLFKSYISNWLQYVQTDEIKTARSTITCGLSKGSILGPLLLIFYVIEINFYTKDLKYIHFVNDSRLYAKHKSFSGLSIRIDTELHKVTKWF